MAQYVMNTEVETLQQHAPAKLAKLIADGTLEQDTDGDWIVWNRGSEAEVVRAAEAARDQARAAVEVNFAKHNGEWAVSVPADQYREGAAAEVVKRDGTRKPVVLGAKLGERNGKVIAAFADGTARTEQTARAADPAAEALRIGRSYGVNGQIWDNA